MSKKLLTSTQLWRSDGDVEPLCAQPHLLEEQLHEPMPTERRIAILRRLRDHWKLEFGRSEERNGVLKQKLNAARKEADRLRDEIANLRVA